MASQASCKFANIGVNATSASRELGACTKLSQIRSKNDEPSRTPEKAKKKNVPREKWCGLHEIGKSNRRRLYHWILFWHFGFRSNADCRYKRTIGSCWPWAGIQSLASWCLHVHLRSWNLPNLCIFIFYGIHQLSSKNVASIGWAMILCLNVLVSSTSRAEFVHRSWAQWLRYFSF